MSHKQGITDVLMVGATGSIGQFAVQAAQRHGLHPRALVRDVRRAEQLLPGVEPVQGHLEDPASLRRAVRGVGVLVLTHAPVATPARVPGRTSATAAYATSCGPSTVSGRASR
ncbi:NAD(P)H-binding protein [Streptomyces sp. NPDC059875]|uniref:NAD(P)H-binding protein n=1 Tax=unclassified Streptomyces TaxID=2593676 RepID=UPI00366572B5